jgi:hypothetical protein
MGKVSKGINCSVKGCEANAIKSLSFEKVKKTELKINEERKVYLCKEHYKEYKKRSKEDRMVDRWRIGKKS